MSNNEAVSTDRLYVLAGRYDQAVYFARDKIKREDQLWYIQEPYQLYGIDGKGKTLFVVGDAYRQKYYNDIINIAYALGFEVKHIP